MFDGYPSETQKDQDYQQETTSLHAFWEGFHDPHSEIISFTWMIGFCPGCSDVVKTHYLGTVTGELTSTLYFISEDKIVSMISNSYAGSF